MSAFTVVVPDSVLLSRVCGTNDNNLRLIENHLNCSVYAYGNELSIDCDSEKTCEKFKFILDRILDEMSETETQVTDYDIVQSVLNINNDCEANYSKECITIPGGLKKIVPRTLGQYELLKAMKSHDIVFAYGPAGSGKTYLCVAKALSYILNHSMKNLILTRPVVEAGENLGFLPGDYMEKLNPYLRPLYDSINDLIPKETVRKLTESGVIEIAPLAYMRGRTLNNSVLILDEAQNTTREQMKMFLTRMGENSKIFITGDPTQIDLGRNQKSGLLHALGVLENVSEIARVELKADDVVRNPLVKKIIQAYEDEKES